MRSISQQENPWRGSPLNAPSKDWFTKDPIHTNVIEDAMYTLHWSTKSITSCYNGFFIFFIYINSSNTNMSQMVVWSMSIKKKYDFHWRTATIYNGLVLFNKASTTGFCGGIRLSCTDCHQALDSQPTLNSATVYISRWVDQGWRLANAQLSFSEKHPILLAKNSHLSLLLMREAHAFALHDGS